MPDSDNQPPQRIWLQWYGDDDPEIEVGPVSEGDVTWCRDKIFEHDFPYVPEARVAEVWDAAVAVIHETLREGCATTHDHDLVSHDRRRLLRALEAARESEGIPTQPKRVAPKGERQWLRRQ